MFLDATGLIRGNRPHAGSAVAVADIDGDGADELVLAGNGGPNRVLKWRGNLLVDVADPLIADAGHRAVALCAADADGDGREELFVLNADGPDRLFAGFGDRWLDLLEQPEACIGAKPMAGRAVSCLDRAATGRYAFILAGSGGPLRLLELDRRGRMHDMAEDAGLDFDCPGRAMAVLPLVSEFLDVFVADGPDLLFRNLGDGDFEDISAACGLTDARPASSALAVFDVDGDFLLFRGSEVGRHRLLRRRPDGRFGDAATADLADAGRVRTAIAADFDNDGCQELFLHVDGGPNCLFGCHDDRWVRLDPGDALEAAGCGAGLGIADVDGDGRLELLLAHGGQSGQAPTLYRPVPNDYGWLRVRPLTRRGAPARGAVVTCLSGGRMQRRAICAGTGAMCQAEPVAHFGLGEASSVERVQVRWPDGLSVIVDGPEPNRLLVVPHPQG